MIRVVYNASEEMSVDLTGKKPGRGAYVCRSMLCLSQAIKTNRLERGLHAKVEKEVVEFLEDIVKQFDEANHKNSTVDVISAPEVGTKDKKV